MPIQTSINSTETAPFFVGEVVKTVVRTISSLQGQLGVVVAIGPSHVCVEYGPGRVYWIAADLLIDAGACQP